MDCVILILFSYRVRLFSDAEKIPVSDEIVIQEFLTQLLLINGRKFHVRCFVLVTSCDPLHIYLYSNGVAFLASESYVDANETNLVRIHQLLNHHHHNHHHHHHHYNHLHHLHHHLYYHHHLLHLHCHHHHCHHPLQPSS